MLASWKKEGKKNLYLLGKEKQFVYEWARKKTCKNVKKLVKTVDGYSEIIKGIFSNSELYCWEPSFYSVPGSYAFQH